VESRQGRPFWRYPTILVALLLALGLDLAFIHLTPRTPSHVLLIAAALTACLLALSWRNPEQRLLALIIAVGIGALAALLLVRRARIVFPLADTALLEIYTKRVLTAELLVGPYSRFGWHHPGPAYFYLLAPFYALSDLRSAGLNAGAFTLGLCAVVTVAWSVARSFNAAVSVPIIASIVWYAWRARDLIVSAWNPHAVILPTLAVVVSCAAVASHDIAMLPIAVVLASLSLQTNLGTGPAVVALLCLAVGAALVHLRNGRATSGHRTIVAVSVGLFVVLWLMPVVEQVSHSPGNMTVLWRFFVSGPGPGQSFSTAAAGWAAMMSSVVDPNFSPFISGTFVAGPTWLQSAAVLQIVLIGAVIAWARQRRDRPLAWLASCCLIASTVGLWSVTRVQGTLMRYQIIWMSALGSLNLGVVFGAACQYLSGAGAARQAPLLIRSAVPGIQGVLLAAYMWLGFYWLVPTLGGRLPATLTTDFVRRLSADIQSYLAEHQVRRPLFRLSQEPWGTAAGILLDLDRAGVRFAVEENWRSMFPNGFERTGDEDAELTVADADTHRQLDQRPGNVIVASGRSLYIDAVLVDARHESPESK
jgi:hypothetical protein